MGIRSRVCLHFVLGSFFLGGLSVGAAETPVVESQATAVSVKPAGTVLIEHFIEDMQKGQMRPAYYRFPFWLDHYWIQEANTLQLLFAEGAKQRPFPQINNLRVEIHPLALLAEKAPNAWEKLSLKASEEFRAQTRLALVFFDIQTPESTKKSQENWLLVQQDAAGEWKLTGLLER